MKRMASTLAVASLAIALAACGGAEEALEDTATSVATGGAESTEVANPWTDYATAEEAAAAAGLDGFSEGAGAITRLGDEYQVNYLAMDGVAEATIEYPASILFVRKGVADGSGDVSGDYNAYASTWTVTVGDIEVTCAGNREGESQKTIWHAGDYDYSILTLGLGGDDAFGLTAEDIQAIVPAIS